ncbi:MAG: helix-turn-helix domain-containing protein [Candidatus Omnitrophica bacterium]|nr:helix-turn-helix domain-containing protein [Candidatus Omnitrophota bacterium]
MTKDSIQPFAVYTIDETANLLGCHARTVYKKIKDGELCAKKVGVAHKILGENVLSYLGSVSHPPVNQPQNIDTSGVPAI